MLIASTWRLVASTMELAMLESEKSLFSITSRQS